MAPATATETATASLVNISTEKWPPRHRTYFGSLEVRSPESGETYAITPIRGCTGVMDLGDKRIMEYRITAREINGDSGEGSFHGVFVAAGELPTEAELADARQRLEEFQRRLVAAADLEWERTKNPMFITDLERRAVRLGRAGTKRARKNPGTTERNGKAVAGSLPACLPQASCRQGLPRRCSRGLRQGRRPKNGLQTAGFSATRPPAAWKRPAGAPHKLILYVTLVLTYGNNESHAL